MIAYPIYDEAINVNSVYGYNEYNSIIPKKVYTLEIVDNNTIIYEFIIFLCYQILLFLIKVLLEFTIFIKKIIKIIIILITYQLFLSILKKYFISEFVIIIHSNLFSNSIILVGIIAIKYVFFNN